MASSITTRATCPVRSPETRSEPKKTVARHRRRPKKNRPVRDSLSSPPRCGRFGFHSSHFSFRLPQCVSLRSGLKTRASLRWIARSVAMRARNIQAGPRSAAWVKVSAAATTSGVARRCARPWPPPGPDSRRDSHRRSTRPALPEANRVSALRATRRIFTVLPRTYAWAERAIFSDC
jgi:hypothetical protein